MTWKDINVINQRSELESDNKWPQKKEQRKVNKVFATSLPEM